MRRRSGTHTGCTVCGRLARYSHGRCDSCQYAYLRGYTPCQQCRRRMSQGGVCYVCLRAGECRAVYRTARYDRPPPATVDVTREERITRLAERAARGEPLFDARTRRGRVE